jgi:hypothetical protein
MRKNYIDKRGVERKLDQLVADVFGDLERDSRKLELERVKADPGKHKTTRLMAAGKPCSYRYALGAHGVRYCWTCWRNAAGYFLSFREIHDHEARQVRRDKWVAHKKRKLAKDTAQRWASDSRKGR